MMRVNFRKSLLIFILIAALAVPVTALAMGLPFPEVIPLPTGFRPEGIAIGMPGTFYTGSLANGAIYRGDLRTGEGEVLVPGQEGRVAVGMALDKFSGYLFVAGGPTGQAYVVDSKSGEELAVYTLSSGGEFGVFINDVIVTPQAAYFTNSFEDMIYRVPLGPDRALPDESEITAIQLGGDWEQVPGFFIFNANGIEAMKNGSALIIVNSTLGALFRVDPETGYASMIDLGGASMQAGDGLVLLGRTLYVVQNSLNQVAQIELDPALTSGEVVGTLTSPNFDVPTTAAAFGKFLYLPNARFGIEDPGNAEYDVVRVSITR
jgi:hypothetical protein